MNNAYRDLETAGHPNAWLVMRGSLNTGFRFTRRLLFDTGEKSDVDLAIVDAQLFEQARRLGVEIRGGGRTAPIRSNQLRPLGLEPALVRIQAAIGRPKITFMIFKDWGSVTKRGEYRILP